MKPIIGMNLDVKEGPPEHAQVQANYYRAIQRSGGIPVLVPPMPEEDLDALLSTLDGVLFIGGDDYCPSNYGEEAHEKVERCHPERDEFDVRLIKKALAKEGMPILGICAGAQLLNIVMGGSLIQDIPSFVEKSFDHTSKDPFVKGWNKHPVKVELKSALGSIYKSATLEVVSSHHQAIRKLGNGLTAVAWAEDGIIEAVESNTRPFTIGVQWHPERDYETNIPLFNQFVHRCSQQSTVTGAKAAAKSKA